MITIERTLTAQEATVTKLEDLAARTGRSVTDLATEALEAYLKQGRQASLHAPAPVVRRKEDLALSEWPQEENDAFLNYLEAERQDSLRNDGEQQRY